MCYANRGEFSNVKGLTSTLTTMLPALSSASQPKISNGTRCSKCVCFSFPSGLGGIFLSNVTLVAHPNHDLVQQICLAHDIIEAEADTFKQNGISGFPCGLEVFGVFVHVFLTFFHISFY